MMLEFTSHGCIFEGSKNAKCDKCSHITEAYKYYIIVIVGTEYYVTVFSSNDETF